MGTGEGRVFNVIAALVTLAVAALLVMRTEWGARFNTVVVAITEEMHSPDTVGKDNRARLAEPAKISRSLSLKALQKLGHPNAKDAHNASLATATTAEHQALASELVKNQFKQKMLRYQDQFEQILDHCKATSTQLSRIHHKNESFLKKSDREYNKVTKRIMDII